MKKETTKVELIYFAMLLPTFIIFFLTNLAVGNEMLDSFLASTVGAIVWPLGWLIFFVWLDELGYYFAWLMLKIFFVGAVGVVVIGVAIMFFNSFSAIIDLLRIKNEKRNR